MKKYFLIFALLCLGFLLGGNNVLASSLIIQQTWSLPSDILNFNWSQNGGVCADYQGFVCFDTNGNALAGNNYFLAKNLTMFASQQFSIFNCLNGATNGNFRIVGYNACAQTIPWGEAGNSTYAEFIAGNESTTGYETDGFNILISYTEYIPPPPLTASSSLILIANSALLPAIDLSTNIFFNFWPYMLVISIIAGFIAFILKKLPKRWPK